MTVFFLCRLFKIEFIIQFIVIPQIDHNLLQRRRNGAAVFFAILPCHVLFFAGGINSAFARRLFRCAQFAQNASGDFFENFQAHKTCGIDCDKKVSERVGDLFAVGVEAVQLL